MSAFQKLFVALLAAALVTAAWLWRFEVNAVGRADGAPVAYVLDRWTGEVHMIYGASQRRLTPMPSQPEP